MFGSLAPRKNAIDRLTTPATKPLIAAIWTGSPAETFRVRLLSIAQARQAPPMAKAPHGKPIWGLSSRESRIPPMVMTAIPKAIRLSKFSLNTNQARSAVNTPSIFNSNEEVDAGVLASPVISNTGPITPPKRIAPESQGRSVRFNWASEVFRCRPRVMLHHTSRPQPEPKYNRPASRTGSIPLTNSLAKGVLAPNRTAAASAQVTPFSVFPF